MPAFPQQFTSTISHWQASNRGRGSLWNHGRHDPLPTEVVDYVIIGAGVTGASLAYQITRAGGAADGKSVVVLDAKDVASCASGRNGGHIAPRSWELFGPLTTPLEEGGAGLSEEDALDILYFEAEHLEVTADIIRKEKLDVDLWTGQRLEVFTTDEGVRRNRELMAQFFAAKAKSAKHRHKRVDWELVADTAEAQRLTRLPAAKELIRGPAGSWHPHRGTTGLLRLALASTSSYCRFFSWAPVARLEQLDSGGWALHCGERGVVRAREVVLATNAYTRHLFPEDMARGEGIPAHIIPYRHQACHITPPDSYAGDGALTNSYSVERGPYLIQTPAGGMILGPFSATVIDVFGSKRDMYPIEDDSGTTGKFRNWMAGYCPQNFAGWGAEKDGEGVDRVWSGILCHSVDLVPLVGRVLDKPGLWASISYNGHGMAKIVNITRCLAENMRTGVWDDRLPRCFEITHARLERAKKCKPFLDEVKDAEKAKL
ncbi:hypothetical protein VHUM_03263 [Vanrija humicola]|uniref:FAD dependent oxidoreductase domain-containing protein n=1 Tax=Vanrija humicola TaxID=5417 RepID=A0A7D8UYV4_VANHU|nr:hypothetical protein VHUM_03263 [Vanrija humicola]